MIDDDFEDDIDFEEFGAFGNMRRNILQCYREELYEQMKADGTLREHLQAVENEYAAKYERLVREQMKHEGITDTAENRAIIENIRTCAREFLFDEMCPPEWIAEDFDD